MLLLRLAAVLIVAPAVVSGRAKPRRPNLEGIWNSATTTPLERPANLKDKPFFTPEEAAAGIVSSRDGTRSLLLARKQTGTGTYNMVYREFGTRTVKTLRTSIITEPPDGRIPALTPAAAAVKRRRLEGLKKFENPEDLGLQDQCLAFLTAGPPMLPYSYNSNYQIVQTGDAVLDPCGNDPRRAHRPAERQSARAVADQIMARRFDRPLGRRDTRRGHDEFQRRRRVLRRRRRQLRMGSQPSPRRALQLLRRRYVALQFEVDNPRRSRGRGRASSRWRDQPSPSTSMHATRATIR